VFTGVAVKALADTCGLLALVRRSRFGHARQPTGADGADLGDHG